LESYLDKTNVRNPIWEKPHCLESYNSNFLAGDMDLPPE
jgi:hypothetical protein